MAATMEQAIPSLQEQELSREVQEVLLRYDPIRSTDAPITVTSADGVVTLQGIVRTRATKSVAEKLTRDVRGVTDVRNQLLSDSDVEATVGLELAMNERLRKAGGMIRVKSLLGTVYLAGDVAAETVEEAEELKELAEELALDVPGVARVRNNLVARERGQVAAAVAEEEEAGGLTPAQEAELAELRERREVWAERAGE